MSKDISGLLGLLRRAPASGGDEPAEKPNGDHAREPQRTAASGGADLLSALMGNAGHAEPSSTADAASPPKRTPQPANAENLLAQLFSKPKAAPAPPPASASPPQTSTPQDLSDALASGKTQSPKAEHSPHSLLDALNGRTDRPNPPPSAPSPSASQQSLLDTLRGPSREGSAAPSPTVQSPSLLDTLQGRAERAEKPASLVSDNAPSQAHVAHVLHTDAVATPRGTAESAQGSDGSGAASPSVAGLPTYEPAPAVEQLRNKTLFDVQSPFDKLAETSPIGRVGSRSSMSPAPLPPSESATDAPQSGPTESFPDSEATNAGPHVSSHEEAVSGEETHATEQREYLKIDLQPGRMLDFSQLLPLIDQHALPPKTHDVARLSKEIGAASRDLIAACDEFLVYASSKSGHVQLVDQQTGKSSLLEARGRNRIVDLKMNSASQLLSVDERGNITVWDCHTIQVLCEIVVDAAPSAPVHATWLGESNFIGFAYETKLYRLRVQDTRVCFNINNEEAMRDAKCRVVDTRQEIRCIGASSDYSVLAVATRSMVRFWDARSFAELYQLQIQGIKNFASFTYIGFPGTRTAASRLLELRGDDKHIALIDIAEKKIVYEFSSTAPFIVASDLNGHSVYGLRGLPYVGLISHGKHLEAGTSQRDFIAKASASSSLDGEEAIGVQSMYVTRLKENCNLVNMRVEKALAADDLMDVYLSMQKGFCIMSPSLEAIESAIPISLNVQTDLISEHDVKIMRPSVPVTVDAKKPTAGVLNRGPQVQQPSANPKTAPVAKEAAAALEDIGEEPQTVDDALFPRRMRKIIERQREEFSEELRAMQKSIEERELKVWSAVSEQLSKNTSDFMSERLAEQLQQHMQSISKDSKRDIKLALEKSLPLNKLAEDVTSRVMSQVRPELESLRKELEIQTSKLDTILSLLSGNGAAGHAELAASQAAGKEDPEAELRGLLAQGEHEKAIIKYSAQESVDLFPVLAAAGAPDEILEGVGQIGLVGAVFRIAQTLGSNTSAKLQWLRRLASRIDPTGQPQVQKIVPGVVQVAKEKLEVEYDKLIVEDSRNPNVRQIPIVIHLLDLIVRKA